MVSSGRFVEFGDSVKGVKGVRGGNRGALEEKIDGSDRCGVAVGGTEWDAAIFGWAARKLAVQVCQSTFSVWEIGTRRTTKVNIVACALHKAFDSSANKNLDNGIYGNPSHPTLIFAHQYLEPTTDNFPHLCMEVHRDDLAQTEEDCVSQYEANFPLAVHLFARGVSRVLQMHPRRPIRAVDLWTLEVPNTSAKATHLK